MKNGLSGDLVEGQPEQHAAQPHSAANDGILPVPPQAGILPTPQAPILPLPPVLPEPISAQLMDISLQEFFRRLNRWPSRTDHVSFDTPRNRLSWVREVREGRIGAGSLTTKETQEAVHGPFNPASFSRNQNGQLCFFDGISSTPIEETGLYSGANGGVFHRTLILSQDTFTFRVAPYLSFSGYGSKSENTSKYAKIVSMISGTQNQEFATNVLRLLKNSNKPLQGNTIDAARKVSQLILSAERVRTEKALALAYSEFYRLKHDFRLSATNLLNESNGTFIAAQEGGEELVRGCPLEQIKRSFDSACQLKANKFSMSVEDSVKRKLLKLVNIFGYDVKQVASRPSFGEYFRESQVATPTPRVSGHRVVSVSGEGNACLLRAVLIALSPNQRQVYATMQARDVREQIRQAILARLADPETSRLLQQDYIDYLDLFGLQALPQNITPVVYLDHFLNRQTFEGREMIALLGHVYQRRILVHNHDRYLQEEFGDPTHEPLHLHFTNYLGTEPFPNHYDVYVPVSTTNEVQAQTEPTPGVSIAIETELRSEQISAEVLSIRAFEIMSILEASFDNSEDLRLELIGELENILGSPLISDALKRLIKQKLNQFLLGSWLQGFGGFERGPEPPPSAGAAGTTSGNGSDSGGTVRLSPSTQASGASQMTKGSSQAIESKQQSVSSSIMSRAPARNRPVLTSSW
ncbi:MAG: OTU domain-containing protein [Myxococcaceae bacterium]